MKHFLVLLYPLASLAAQPGHAQKPVPGLSLTGNVQTDAQQALPGAVVTVIHVPSGTSYTTVSSATGRFMVANLRAGGPYVMQVGEGGYRSQTVESIFLGNGKTSNFSLTLTRLGSAAQGGARHPTVAASKLAATPTAPVPIKKQDAERDSRPHGLGQLGRNGHQPVSP